MANYSLPQLPYGYKELEPYISEQLLTIHHQKHHQSYVNGANGILGTLEKSRIDNTDVDMKAMLKALSFNVGGHLLHSLFWQNMAGEAKGRGKAGGAVADTINKEFGSFERFKKEFSQCAVSVEGSGWAVLSFSEQTNRPIIMQIEKHNANVIPMFRILLALDVWEHAYYIDYKNDRAKFIESFWNIINWDEVNKRFSEITK